MPTYLLNIAANVQTGEYPTIEEAADAEGVDLTEADREVLASILAG